MVGLDTNHLVQFVTRDDAEPWQVVDRFRGANCSAKQPGWITYVTLLPITSVQLKAIEGQLVRDVIL